MRMAADAVWRQEGEALVRDFGFDDFRGAMAFVNRVADAAEEVNHHPDILVHGWNKVRLTLSSHSEGRVTDNDHALAQRIDGLVAWLGPRAIRVPLPPVA
jgi:4a-hydroxytetrahydrobiopterin dehydratase